MYFWMVAYLACSRMDKTIVYVDNDGDGFSEAEGDCDDDNPATFPGAAENESTEACLTDADGDGWSLEEGDCDDDNAQVPNNDADCDGVMTSEDCDDDDPLVGPPCDVHFVYGTIAGQNGWSGMINGGNQPESFAPGTMVVGDEDARGDSIVGSQLPEVADVANGHQSWWFKRGYDSPGSGTPYSPVLTPADSDQGFRYQVSFKAVDASGDGSKIAVISGDLNGDDRASNFVRIENEVGNLKLVTYEDDFVTIVDALEPSVWHTFRAEMVRRDDLDYWTYWVDGVEVLSNQIGYFSQFRIDNGYAYTESVRLKFHPAHPNWDAAYQGFLFDDLITQTWNTVTGEVIESYFTGFE